MEISELICTLEKLKESVGDIEVFAGEERRSKEFLHKPMITKTGYWQSVDDNSIRWIPCVVIA